MGKWIRNEITFGNWAAGQVMLCQVHIVRGFKHSPWSVHAIPENKQENVEVLIKRSASVLSLSSGDSSTQPGCRGGNGGRNGGASTSHSAVIGSIELFTEHLVGCHYASATIAHALLWLPHKGQRMAFHDYRTADTHHLVKLPVLRCTICPLFSARLRVCVCVCLPVLLLVYICGSTQQHLPICLLLFFKDFWYIRECLSPCSSLLLGSAYLACS